MEDNKSRPPEARRLALATVAVCFCVGLAARGTIETFTVFILPLSAEFGWSRSALAGIYSVALLTAGLAAPLAGELFDRLGPRLLYSIGLGVAVGGLALSSLAVAPWQLYLTFGVATGLASAALGNVPSAALLSRWFTGRLGIATGFVFSSIGVGTLVLVPYAQVLIGAEGWRGAYRILALSLLVLAPLLMLAPWRRIAAGTAASQAARSATIPRSGRRVLVSQAIRTPAYWGLSWVYFATAIGIYSVVVQIVAYLVETGVPPLTAAGAYGMTGIFTPLGMVGFGWIADRLNRRAAVALSYGLTIAAYLGLLTLTHDPYPAQLFATMAALGLSLGSRGPLVSTIAARLFRGPSFGRIFGMIALCGGLGSAIGALSGGMLYDLTGGYRAGLYLGIVAVALGSAPFWLLRELGRR